MDSKIYDLTIIVIVQPEDKEPEKCINSILEYNDIDKATLIVYNNSKNLAFHEWASIQKGFLYAYSENGIIPYATAMSEILNELDIHSDILVVNAHHVAYPGLLSKMYNALHLNERFGVVASSFNGANNYGLGFETFITDYNRLTEVVLDNRESWESHYIDPEGSILIRENIVERLKVQNNIFDRKDYFNALEKLVKQMEYTIQVLMSGFWFNLQDDTTERIVETKPKGIQLTIAIPTYNRANRALDAVNHIIEKRKEYRCEDSIEILVSDNCSKIHLEELEQIEKLSEKEKNINLFKSDINKGFKGNIKKVIENSKGKYCLIQSDEDKTLFPAVLLYLEYLDIHPDIVCMKGRTSFQCANMKPNYGKKGLDAIKSFYLRGNYISGVIYKREVITNEFLDELYFAFDNKNNVGFDYYPHLFIDAYALCNGSFASSNIMLREEGKPEETGDSVGNEMFSFERPESRIAQGTGYIKQLDFLKIDDKYKFFLFYKIIQKTIFLLNLSKKKYLEEGYVWDKIVKDTVEMFKKEFADLKMKDKRIYESLILSFLGEMENSNFS